MPILELRNSIRDYAWGSTTLIPELLGVENPGGAPLAEIWLGAHPGAPSAVQLGDTWVSLADWIRDDPERALGEGVCKGFEGQLPFLLKVLAAAHPLSLQAHPDAARARAGFEREEALGIERRAPERCYPDPCHKPELICALTPFDAMLGFREVEEILENFGRLAIGELSEPVASLATGGATALPGFFRALLELDDETLAAALRGARARSGEHRARPEYRWLARLAELYPRDPGALAPLYLNVIRLEPGEAVFLPAGELHSYLGGCGVEIMASSDNVLRGGLTPKHVDQAELLEVLTFATGRPKVVRGEPQEAGERLYPSPAREFALSLIELDGEWRRDEAHEGPPGPEILLCVEGEARAKPVGEPEVDLGRGRSCFVPGSVSAYGLSGRGRIFRARVG